uniref:DNA polymerase epsilon catalytic subunit n=1 Tax=Romanomermis culicivorax TaxID=13658 RepID=A0A915HL00_ROMCU
MDIEDHDFNENDIVDQNDNFDDNFSNNTDGKLSRYQVIQNINQIDLKFGFTIFKEARTKVAWLMNMHPAEVITEDNQFLSAVNYYFIEENGDRFKISLPYKPYLYVATVEHCEKEASLYLSKKYAGDLTEIEIVAKDDLNLPNHLIGLQRTFLKLSFLNVQNLTKVKRDLMPKIRKNREKQKSKSDYADMLSRFFKIILVKLLVYINHRVFSHFAGKSTTVVEKSLSDQIDNIIDIREHDVPYHVRVSIDLKIFVGKWYNVVGKGENDKPQITLNEELIDWPEPIVLAFDIETTKEVLKFPDAKIDKIMMISYMIDGRGFLIVNREIVSQDVEDFEYTPKPEYEGCFTVYNEKNEYELLIRFFEHIQLVKPHIFVTPFVETRAASYNLNMCKEIGFAKDAQGEYKSSQSIHMDAFK